MGKKTEGTQKLLRYILFNGTEQLVRKITRPLAALCYTLVSAELLVNVWLTFANTVKRENECQCVAVY